MKKIGNLLHKTFSLVMSALMMISCVNMTGIQSVFAADVTLGAQGKTNSDLTTKTIPEVWTSQNVTAVNGKIDNSVAFSLDVAGTMQGNRYLDRSTLETNKGNLRQALNWYYANPSEENFWIAQTVIWGFEAGKITTYTGDAILPEIQKVFDTVGLTYVEANVKPKVEAISEFSSAGTYYVYTLGDENTRLVSNSQGTVPTVSYTTVNSHKEVKRNENITVKVNKTDSTTHNGLSGATFEFYRDNSKVSTKTTDSQGVAQYTFSTEIAKQADASADYVTNYNVLSPKNQTLALQSGTKYASQELAQNAADTQAQNDAYTACYEANTGEHAYKVIETSTKEAYYLNPDNTTFTKAYTGKYNADVKNDGTVTFDVQGDRQLGTITIQKSDAEKNSRIQGAVYGLYAKDDILNPDGSGTVEYRARELVKTFEATDENGTASLDNLYLGNYFVKEITAPTNYIKDETEYDVSLLYAGQNQTVTTVNQGVTDKWQPGTITVTKVDDETGTPIEGVVFELYARNNIKHPDGKSADVYKAGDKIGEFSATNAKGIATFSGLYLGDYYIKEKDVPAPYYCNPAEKDVVLKYAGQNEQVATTSVKFENHRQEGQITITQTDSETNKKVPGAVYELYAAENIDHPDGVKGRLYDKDELVGTFDPTDENGQSTLKKLYLGKYYIVQKTAPDGYVYAENRTEITIDYTTSNISVNLKNATGENKVQRGTISFSKKDKELYEGTVNANKVDTDNNGAQTDATLKGATYGLYAKKDINHKDTKTGPVTYNAKVKDLNEITLLKGTDLKVMNTKATKGTLLATAKTDENGEISFGNLYLGDYYIKEVEASEGYNLDDTEYPVSLTYADQEVETTSAETTVFEKVMKRAFTITKYSRVPNTNETPKPLKDVEFEVKLESDIQRLVNQGMSLEQAKENAPLFDTITTDKNGKATTVELPYGTYRVMETKTAVNHNNVEDFFVEIKDDSRTPLEYTTPIYNDYFFANLKIKTVDSETGKQILLPNAEYKIKALEKVYVNGKTFQAGEYIDYFSFDVLNGFTVNSWTTDEKGNIKLGEKLSAGLYQLELVKAPKGYILDENPVKFEITTEGVYQLDENGEPEFTVTKELDPAKTQINVSKKGETLKGYKDGQFTYELNGLSDAKYQIIAKENIMDPSNDGNVLYVKNSVVETVTTGSKGTVKTTNLPLGEYTVKEINAPHGYSLNKETQDIRGLYVDENTPVVAKNVEFTNDRQHYTVEGIKLDKETNEALKGAEFSVYANEDIYNANNELIVARDTKVASGVTGDNGNVILDTDLPTDYDFYMLETKTPLGYVSTTQREDFATDYTDDSEQFVRISKTFKNDPTTVEIAKTDEVSKVKPAGTNMSVVDENNEVVASWTTEQGKTHIIKKLHVGKTYRIVEDLAAYGYLKANDIEFTVEDTADVQYHEMTDAQSKGTITLTKKGDVLVGKTVDENGNVTFKYEARGLPNAKYNVFAKEDIVNPDNESANYYNAGDLVATITTNDKGVAKTDKLPLGKYEVQEVTAPTDFVLNKEVKEASVNYVDQLTPVTNTDVEYSSQRQTVKVEAEKNDKDTGEHVKGAQFTMYASENILDVDGNVVLNAGDKVRTVTTDENGKATYTNDLPLSTYTVKETKAPVGYSSTAKVEDLDATYRGQDVATINLTCGFENNPTKVELSKVDDISDVKTAGNILELYDADKNLVDTWTTELNKTHTMKYLHVGETYTLVEKLAATGYLKANDVTFVVEDKGDSGDVQIIEAMRNTQAKGQITITKQGEVLTGYKDGNFTYETRNLPNAEFEVYAKEDIVNPDGVSKNYYNAGDLVTTVTTNETGTIKTPELPLGKYVVKEVNAPKGMVLDSSEIEVNLVYKDQNTPVVFESTSKVNARQKVTLNLNKLDKETNTALFGAEFTLYANKDIVNYDGEVILNKGDVVTKATSNKNGKVTFKVDLPVDLDGTGTAMFYAKETARPTGYASLNQTVEFDTAYQGQDKSNISISYDMFNEQTRMQFRLEDASTGSVVENSQLTIIPVKEDGTLDEGASYETWITDGNAHVVKGLEPGKYVLRHTLGQAKAQGYVTSKDVEFTVEDTADMQTTVMTVEHTNTVFGLKDTLGKYLENSQLSIVPLDENGEPLKGETFDEWLTTDNTHEVIYLPVGKYQLVQNVVTEGYVKALPVTFEVKDTSKTQSYEMINKQISFGVHAVKDTTLLTDSEIQVVDEAGNIVDTWTTDENVHYIKGLVEDEKYTIKQVSATKGYVASKDMIFTAESNKENQDILMVNKVVEISKLDTNKEFVQGAKMSIVSADTNETVDEWTSNDKTYTPSNLREGMNYDIREVEAPEGYVRASDVEFTVSDEKVNEAYEMVNKQFTITKLDENGKTLKDAKLIVVERDTNKTVDKWTTDGNGHIVKGLEEGKSYLLKEQKAPRAYKVASPIDFTIDNVKENQSLEMKDELILTDVVISVVDSKTQEPIKGKDFSLGIYEDEACTKELQVVKADTENGTVTFTDLPYGTYYVKQVSAPEGYVASNEIVKIVIDENFDGVGKIHNMKIENTVVETPKATETSENEDKGVKTGDTTAIAGSVMALALSGCAIKVISSRKKKDEE